MNLQKNLSLKEYILFSIPLMFQVLLHNLVGITDNLMIGRLGAQFMAALTIASRYYFFLTILLLAIVGSVNILGSQAWGEGNIHNFKVLYGTAFTLVLSFSLILSMIIFFWGKGFIGLMTSDAQVFKYAADYFRIMAFVILASSINILISGIFIASGDTKIPFFQQLITTLLNVLLNYCLIYGRLGFPRLSVQGAAVASLISILVGNILLIIQLYRQKKNPHWSSILAPNASYMKQIFQIGLPILGDMLVWQISIMLYIRFISDFGSDALAIYGVAGIYMMIQSIMVMGYINGAGVTAGHLIGAKDIENLHRFINRSLGFTLFISVICNTILIGISFYVPSFFQLSGEAIRTCTMVLVVISIRHIFQTICGYLSAVVRAGKSTFSLFLMSLFSFLFIGFPLSYLAGPVLKGGILWIALAFTLEEIGKSVITSFIAGNKFKKNAVSLRV